MALTSRERNMVIGIIAVLVIAAIGGAFFLGKRGGDDKSATSTTPTATQTTQTQTQTVVTVTVPAEAPPAETTPPANTGVEIVEQSINPSTVGRGAPIAVNVRTRGDVLSVRMDISGPQDSSVDLNRGPTVNGITTWAAATNAPGIVGLFRYSAKVSAGDGSVVEAPVSTFTVVP